MVLKYSDVKIEGSLEYVLRKRGALRRFKNNVVKQRSMAHPSNVYSNIGVSFNWNMSPEGIGYWAEIRDYHNALAPLCREPEAVMAGEAGALPKVEWI